MKDKLTIVFAVICLCLVSILFVLLIKKNTKCDEHIVLDDNTQYDCKSVTSFANGVSSINLCNGERIVIPTHRIKIITEIK
jgi:hypothetical protein